MRLSTSAPRWVGGAAVLALLAGCNAPAVQRTTPAPSASFETLPGPAPTYPDSMLATFAPGIPRLLQRLPDGARLLVTSATNEARDKVTVSVSFTCALAPNEVIAFYDKLAAPHSFEPIAASPASGVASTTFTKKSTGEYFTVTALPGAGATSVTVFGALVPDLD